MNLIISWLIGAVIVILTAYVLPGVRVQSFVTALLVAVVLGLLYAVIRPLLLFLTLPVNVLTLGLFTFVVNAILVLIASAVVPGFQVDNFWYALLFSLVFSVLSVLIGYYVVRPI